MSTSDTDIGALLETSSEELEPIRSKIVKLEKLQQRLAARLKRLHAVLDALTTDDELAEQAESSDAGPLTTSTTPSKQSSKKSSKKSSTDLIRDLLRESGVWMSRREICETLESRGTPVSMQLAHIRIMHLVKLGEVEQIEAPRGAAAKLVYATKGTAYPSPENEVTLFTEGGR